MQRLDMDIIPSEGFHSREMDFWFRVLMARRMRRRVGRAALMGSDFDMDSSYGVFFYIPEGWDGAHGVISVVRRQLLLLLELRVAQTCRVGQRNGRYDQSIQDALSRGIL